LTPPATTRTVLLSYAIVGPGVRVTRRAERDACCPGIQVTHVLTGTYALRVNGPLQVVHGNHMGRLVPREAIAPETDVLLEAGDTAVSTVDLTLMYANPGTDSVHLVVARLGSRVPPPRTMIDDLATRRESSPAPPLPSGPLLVTLQRATLPPDGILPAPSPGTFRTVLTGLALAPLETGRDGSVQNRGRRPVVVYALTLHLVDSVAGPHP
jgi:hypothetical protein